MLAAIKKTFTLPVPEYRVKTVYSMLDHELARWVKMLRELHPIAKDLEEQALSQFIRRCMSSHSDMVFAIQKKDLHLGGLIMKSIGIDDGEIMGLWVDPKYQRQGLGTTLVLSALNYMYMAFRLTRFSVTIDKPTPKGAEEFWDALLKRIDKSYF